MTTIFRDREAGGAALAEALSKYRGEDVVVYGLPRGGVVTARVVATALQAPLDLIITRKLGHPRHREYAVGAVAEDGQVALNEAEVAALPRDWLEREKQAQLSEARRRRQVYLGDRAPLPVKGKTAILVDDGIATGYTMKAAILAIRRLGPAKVVVAAPVAPPDAASRFVGLADEFVVPHVPHGFHAIGQFYGDFDQVEDDQVIALMHAPSEAV
jgi:putative phosphoribosyl transferase